MGNWKVFNPNPTKNRVGDCTIRALSKALEQDWETTYAALSAYGYSLCDMPNANWVRSFALSRCHRGSPNRSLVGLGVPVSSLA